MNDKAIVLLSGGQDSTTCLFWALQQFKDVQCVIFNYGQRHAKEIEFAVSNCQLLKLKYTVIPVYGLSGSSLTDHTKDINSSHPSAPSHIPSSFTPGRNVMFLTIAAGMAYNNTTKEENEIDLVAGVCQTDYSGYFDCRRVFIDSMVTSLSLALGKDVRIHTPLMYLTKAETWKLARDMSNSFTGTFPLGDIKNIIDFIRYRTLTDYNGDTTENEWGLGKDDNPASKLRKAGYEEAKVKGWLV